MGVSLQKARETRGCGEKRLRLLLAACACLAVFVLFEKAASRAACAASSQREVLQGESPSSRGARARLAEARREEAQAASAKTPSRQRKNKTIRDVAQWRDAVGLVLIAVSCVVAVAAGTGGGSVYVPVLTLVMDFSPHTATAMSQALMCGGVLAGTILNLARRHPETDGPLIDLDLVILLAPAQMAGVSLGQVVNRCLPPWLLVCFLVAVLSVAVYQTLKQYKRCRAARLARKKAKHQEASSGEESCSFRTLSLPAPATARAEAAPPPQRGKAKTETETEMETDCPENQQGDFEEDGRKRRALQVREKEDGESEAKAAVCEGQDASAEETGTLGNKSTLAEAVEADSFDSDVSLSRAEKEKRSRLQRTKRRLKKADERHGLGKWFLLIAIWIADVAMGLIRGGDGSPVKLVEYCGVGYWSLYVGSAVLLIGASFGEGVFLMRQQNNEGAFQTSATQTGKETATPTGEIVFSLRTVHTLLLQTLLAGFVAGVVGIGSALVMGPLLLLRGVLPVVSSAVNTALVLCSSSSAAAKAMLDSHTPSDYAALLFALCFVCAVAGKSCVDRWVKRHDADYVLILLLVFIMSASMICMLASGVIGVLSNESQAFKGPCG